jgi:ubiquitin-conjugating enzyme E2 R
MVLSEDSPYHGGYFKAQMIFPYDYPYSPPKFRFTPAIYHPNVYKDGLLCISILHKSGDATSDEPDGETWSPAQSVETVLISIVSLLSDPNINSPANVDAAVAWRKDRDAYNKKVAQDVDVSKHNIPTDFQMPVVERAYVAPKGQEGKEDVVDDDFWYESADSEDDESLMVDDYEDEEEEGSDNPDYDD